MLLQKHKGHDRILAHISKIAMEPHLILITICVCARMEVGKLMSTSLRCGGTRKRAGEERVEMFSDTLISDIDLLDLVLPNGPAQSSSCGRTLEKFLLLH